MTVQAIDDLTDLERWGLDEGVVTLEEIAAARERKALGLPVLPRSDRDKVDPAVLDEAFRAEDQRTPGRERRQRTAPAAVVSHESAPELDARRAGAEGGRASMSRADRIDIDGWPVAHIEAHEAGGYTGHLFLYRTSSTWTLLTITEVTGWDPETGRPRSGRAEAIAATYAGLAELRSAMMPGPRAAEWRELVKVGSASDHELRALWTPVRIDHNLERSSVHRRELRVGGERRRSEGWQAEALGLAVERLEELGFVLLAATREPRTIFRRGLGRAWERSGNVVVGAVSAARYGWRADLVVAVDGFGEVYVRTADTSFDPGAPRRYPPRPLNRRESARVDEVHRQRRVDGEEGR